MANKMGVDAMRAKIKKLTEQVRELKAENARLKTGYKGVVTVTEVPKGKQLQLVDERRCSCGLRLFNGKCLSCKKKNTPLSTF